MFASYVLINHDVYGFLSSLTLCFVPEISSTDWHSSLINWQDRLSRSLLFMSPSGLRSCRWRIQDGKPCREPTLGSLDGSFLNNVLSTGVSLMNLGSEGVQKMRNAAVSSAAPARPHGVIVKVLSSDVKKGMEYTIRRAPQTHPLGCVS